MITLYQPPPAWGLPNIGPFCLKLETYLRMAGVPYRVDPNFNPFRAPTGKVPYIEIDGRLMGDSGLIIDLLEARAEQPLDAWLDPLQKAQALAIRRMIEEHLYFGLGYARWANEPNWSLVRATYFAALPLPLRRLIPELLKKKMMASIKGQGLGRHPEATLFALCVQDIDALAVILGERDWMIGERPSSLDACAYGFLANLIRVPLENPLKQAVLAHPNLVDFCERMQAAYFA